MRLAYIALILGIGVFLFVQASRSGRAQSVDGPQPTDLKTTQGLLDLIESEDREYLLIDVRTESEYSSGHIPTAVNIPYQDIVERLPEGPKDRLIVVYCRSGSRSSVAQQALRESGYTNVANFGGILDWKGPIAYPDR